MHLVVYSQIYWKQDEDATGQKLIADSQASAIYLHQYLHKTYFVSLTPVTRCDKVIPVEM